MTPEQTRALLADPRVAALARVLRDGTDEQFETAATKYLDTFEGRALWDEAMRQAYPETGES